MSIVAAISVSDFFGEAVDEAMRSRGVQASDGARSYVVGLLSELAKPGSPVERTLERPLTLLLDEALHTPDVGERFERLRVLGDGVLYSSGFFADHFEARGVEQSYLVGIGTTAYGAASSMLRAPTKEDALDVFAELAAKFGDFASVLADVADSTIAKGASSSKSLLKLYERWLKTGSDRLARTLGEQGLVPTRGPKGMQ